MKENRKELDQDVLSSALDLYGIQSETLKNLHGNESFVYSYSSSKKDYILKIIHHHHRSTEELQAEVEWLYYLHKHNVRVALPIQSKHGNFVENNFHYSIISYEKARGIEIQTSELTEELIQNWGSTMGRMHQVAKKYQPLSCNVRKHWHENQHLTMFSSAPSYIKNKFERVRSKLIHLPKTTDTYGLIHSDFHHKNFLLDKSNITVIDFDDAEYSWFINDIAKTVYNETFNFGVPPKNRNQFAYQFLESFIKGYKRENKLDPYMMEHFQDFLDLRQLFVFMRKYHVSEYNIKRYHEKKIQVNLKNVVNDLKM
ncbi:phosphotransferase enzyme family protein [Bacillus pinisoli]|uniref:phosphotransferase enzyme family protein n=1 Tax=Bacillus pinisoli TaxID=2901866 RepID=UPI001FF52D2E|nr:phosphotransferase [Bacillus pinisoli]